MPLTDPGPRPAARDGRAERGGDEPKKQKIKNCTLQHGSFVWDTNLERHLSSLRTLLVILYLDGARTSEVRCEDRRSHVTFAELQTSKRLREHVVRDLAHDRPQVLQTARATHGEAHGKLR